MKRTIPPRYREEESKLAEKWINSEKDVDEIVKEYASPQYKVYYEKLKEQKEENRRRGIIVD